MKLKYITCSDPREDISVESLLNFTKTYPIAEIGIQVYSGVVSSNWAFNAWLNQLLTKAQNMPKAPNIALHVNQPWGDLMGTGVVPQELAYPLRIKNIYTGQPVIKRVQLNIGNYSIKPKFDVKRLSALIKQHPDQEFILPWNKFNAEKIEIMKLIGTKFSLISDASHNTGKEPDSWPKPLYKDIVNGYTGGLGPDNVAKNLDRINTVLPEDYTTWIDAKGKLCDNDKTFSFSLELAEEYVKNAIAWYNQHTK